MSKLPGGTDRIRTEQGLWHFSDNGGAISTISLGVYFKPNTVFRGFSYRLITATTAGAGAVVSFGLTGIGVQALMANTLATSLSAVGVVTRGVDLEAVPVFAASNTELTMTISVATFTAGSILLYIQTENSDI